MAANHDMVLRVVHERAPGWTPRFVDDMVADRVFTEVQNFAWAVKTDPEHPLRKAVDTFLVEFATDLQNDPHTIERAEQIKQQIVEHPDVQTVHRQGVGHGQDDDPRRRRGPVERAAPAGARRAGRASACGWRPTPSCAPRSTAGWRTPPATSCGTTAREITTLITDTVARWDAEETSRKVELQVGRDLQFIRINGTVVGALAGLVIYTVGQFVFWLSAAPAGQRRPSPAAPSPASTEPSALAHGDAPPAARGRAATVS